jgi:hypothetical protein
MIMVMMEEALLATGGTVKFVAAESSVALLDKDGIMEVYDAYSEA